jgi:hypothetical protein
VITSRGDSRPLTTYEWACFPGNADGITANPAQLALLAASGDALWFAQNPLTTTTTQPIITTTIQPASTELAPVISVLAGATSVPTGTTAVISTPSAEVQTVATTTTSLVLESSSVPSSTVDSIAAFVVNKNNPEDGKGNGEGSDFPWMVLLAIGATAAIGGGAWGLHTISNRRKLALSALPGHL